MRQFTAHKQLDPERARAYTEKRRCVILCCVLAIILPPSVWYVWAIGIPKLLELTR